MTHMSPLLHKEGSGVVTAYVESFKLKKWFPAYFNHPLPRASLRGNPLLEKEGTYFLTIFKNTFYQTLINLYLMFFNFKINTLLSFIFLFILSSCTNGGEEAQRQERQVQIQQQTVELTDNFKTDMETLLDHYFDLKDALVDSDQEEGTSKAATLGEFAENLEPSDLNPETESLWKSYRDVLQAEARNLAELSDLDEQRVHFEAISETMIDLVDTFQPAGYEIYHQSCPMVRGESADWLSREEPIANPYHGENMPNCGETIRRI